MTKRRKQTPKPRVKVYLQERNGRCYWTVVWNVAGERKRRSFYNEDLAKQEAERVEKDLNAGRVALAEIRPEELAHFNMLRIQIPDVPMHRIVQFYLEHHDPSAKSLGAIVKVVCDEFVVSRSGTSERHIHTVRSHLVRFKQTFGDRQLASIQASQIETHIETAVGGSAKTRKNHLITITTLFRWAKTRKYLPFNAPTAAELAERPKVTKSEHEIFTPEELKRILIATPATLIPWATIGAFAGLREAERMRLTWDDWKRDHSAIVLGTKVTKTKRRRSVDVPANLDEWLAIFCGAADEPIVPFYCAHKKTPEIAWTAGVLWKSNALRAGYVSYHLELHGNRPTCDARLAVARH